MSRKRAVIIVTLFTLISLLILGYATMRGLRESGAMSKYQVWVTNNTNQHLFVHTFATPYAQDWQDTDASQYGQMRVRELRPGQTVHMYSSKVHDERTGEQVHPERYLILVDSTYRAGFSSSHLVVVDPDTGFPRLRENTLERLMNDFQEVVSEQSHYSVTEDEQGILHLSVIMP